LKNIRGEQRDSSTERETRLSLPYWSIYFGPDAAMSLEWRIMPKQRGSERQSDSGSRAAECHGLCTARLYLEPRWV